MDEAQAEWCAPEDGSGIGSGSGSGKNQDSELSLAGHRSCILFSRTMSDSPITKPPNAGCILVVDDDANIRRMIMAALKRGGYEFREASNGREALSIMRDGDVGLVLLDLMMPLVSGWDVLREREADTELSKLPVILITASRGPEIQEAVDRGVCAYLPKPFDLAELQDLVSDCILQSPGDEQHCG